MQTIKPIKLGSKKTNSTEKLTSVEMGKLWATYMGNSMGKCILSYYLQNVEDEEIKSLLENALNLCVEIINTIEGIFTKENFPIPKGLTEKDVNIDAPRLFQDEFYVHYLKYTSKAGMSIYNIAIPLVYRKDVKEFFRYCMDSTMDLMEQINEILMNKGLINKPPLIPTPENVEFVHQDFLNGFFGHVRPLHALEITHLYDILENNATSRALINAFAQVVKDEEIRKLFEKGKKIITKNTDDYLKKLHKVNLPTPSFLDDLVSSSTFSPFSDKLLLFHKMEMFTMKIRTFGNAMAVNGRHDMALIFADALIKNSGFVQDAAKIMIEKGWFEKPPCATDRGN
ncbi:DUF3231 family protein [Metabacillus bambusae]|uniref:DUF3231 family protein n=1 Tax=Metabacillus bambusae TaxID=2795218 RepID=A0ABS3MZJ8_9BACI|nr:DUF3231 family protein [Metabacillus bambusae]MBO1511088.1 DUF3231 family protein [Metabacillus bambusae]